MKKYIYLFVIILNSYSAAQNYSGFESVTDTFAVRIDNNYILNSSSIIPYTEIIKINSRTLNQSEYQIRFRNAAFSLQIKNYNLSDTIYVTYKTVKLSLKKEYKRRALIVNTIDNSKEAKRIINDDKQMLSSKSIFGNDLQKSGALIRGFTLGTNKDFTLNSGLRLQMSGKLSDDISIVAALTDENTPIQAEGNTETLDELDKVFIQIKHKNATGTFGDYDLNINRGEFSKVSRKLQGLKSEFNYEKNNATVAIAGSRGKFNSISFLGSDGNQGPYRLYGINNERAIIIIAGSEKVFLDGQLLKRGENNDYVIDYSNAEVTFTPKRLITSASRILIDFEYNDLNYKRNFFGVDADASLFNDNIKIAVGYLREGDDENNPVELSLTDDDKKILEIAGDNLGNSVKSGVSFAPIDSLGKQQGLYLQVDSLINNQLITFYRYSPGNPNSIYNATFTFVGSGNGDYNKISLGKYEYVGSNRGSYSPLIYLPLPQLKQVANVSLNAKLFKGINLDFEFTGSSWDKNKLSDKDDDDNLGYARKILLSIEPQNLNIGGTYLGRVSGSLKDRFVQKAYTSLDRYDDVEFGRQYNVSSQNNSDQTLREIYFNYTPKNNVDLKTKYGFLKQASNFSSNRLWINANAFSLKDWIVFYDYDNVTNKNGKINSEWNKQNGKAAYSLGIIKPGFEFLYENKLDYLNKDSLLAASLKYSEFIPYIEINNVPGIELRASGSIRDEWFPISGSLIKQSESFLTSIQGTYRKIREVTSSLTFTFRKKNYKEEFLTQGFKDNETILLLSQNRFSFWDNILDGELFYQTATEQTARLERVFLRVPQGTGNYIYLGDLNNNGISEENEFQLTAYDGDYIVTIIPTDKLNPVMDLKANTRWKINFSKMISDKNLFTKIIRAVSTETFWRIEENSTDPVTSNIYLLKLSTFLNDSSTIRGSQLFQHDFNLFQNNDEFSLRMRYQQRRSLNQFSGGSELGFFKERSLRFRIKLVNEISNQTDYVNTTDNLLSPPTSNRARTVLRDDLTTDFSYRPSQNYEIGFKILVAQSSDSYPVVASKVSQNTQTVRLNLSLESLGRLRIELERTELISSSKTDFLPFEITKGNVIGKNYFWRVFFDYKISDLIQTSVNYDARLQGKGRVINTFRAEARAYF